MIRIPYLREAGALIALGLIAWALWAAYDWAYDNGYNAANVRAEKIIGEFAKAEAAAQAKARETERRQAQAIADITEQHEREKADAQAAADRLAADLRAGNVRLRKLWRAETETDRLSSAAERARVADEITRLRQEAAARIARIGDEADAQVRGLQAVVRADRNE